MKGIEIIIDEIQSDEHEQYRLEFQNKISTSFINSQYKNHDTDISKLISVIIPFSLLKEANVPYVIHVVLYKLCENQSDNPIGTQTIEIDPKEWIERKDLEFQIINHTLLHQKVTIKLLYRLYSSSIIDTLQRENCGGFGWNIYCRYIFQSNQEDTAKKQSDNYSIKLKFKDKYTNKVITSGKITTKSKSYFIPILNAISTTSKSSGNDNKTEESSAFSDVSLLQDAKGKHAEIDIDIFDNSNQLITTVSVNDNQSNVFILSLPSESHSHLDSNIGNMKVFVALTIQSLQSKSKYPSIIHNASIVQNKNDNIDTNINYIGLHDESLSFYTLYLTEVDQSMHSNPIDSEELNDSKVNDILNSINILSSADCNSTKQMLLESRSMHGTFVILDNFSIKNISDTASVVSNLTKQSVDNKVSNNVNSETIHLPNQSHPHTGLMMVNTQNIEEVIHLKGYLVFTSIELPHTNSLHSNDPDTTRSDDLNEISKNAVKSKGSEIVDDIQQHLQEYLSPTDTVEEGFSNSNVGKLMQDDNLDKPKVISKIISCGYLSESIRSINAYNGNINVTSSGHFLPFRNNHKANSEATAEDSSDKHDDSDHPSVLNEDIVDSISNIDNAKQINRELYPASSGLAFDVSINMTVAIPLSAVGNKKNSEESAQNFGIKDANITETNKEDPSHDNLYDQLPSNSEFIMPLEDVATTIEKNKIQLSSVTPESIGHSSDDKLDTITGSEGELSGDQVEKLMKLVPLLQQQISSQADTIKQLTCEDLNKLEVSVYARVIDDMTTLNKFFLQAIKSCSNDIRSARQENEDLKVFTSMV